MRVLLDHCVPARLAAALAPLAVRTVRDVGWETAGDVEVLRRAGPRFDAFVTVDRRIALAPVPPGLVVVVLHARTNRLADLVPLASAVRRAVETAPRGTVVAVGA